MRFKYKTKQHWSGQCIHGQHRLQRVHNGHLVRTLMGHTKTSSGKVHVDTMLKRHRALESAFIKKLPLKKCHTPTHTQTLTHIR